MHADPRGADDRDDVSRVMAAVLVATCVAVAALRVVYTLHYRFDTDEPQHLHVIWSWVRGRVQYRDVFDNHAPLFHLLLTPLAAALGERADLLVWMRLAMLPLAVLHARRHRVGRHRNAMIAIFAGALVVAGLFTLMPSRIMHAVVFGP